MAFPNGVILYDFTTSRVPDDHTRLFPYESFREAFILIGVADGQSLDSDQPHGAFPSKVQNDFKTLLQDHSRVMSSQLLVFDAPSSLSSENLPNGVIAVPPMDRSRPTTIKTVMCDVSAVLLSDMVAFAKSILSLDTIDSPGSGRPISGAFTIPRKGSNASSIDGHHSNSTLPEERASEATDGPSKSPPSSLETYPGPLSPPSQPANRSPSPQSKSSFEETLDSSKVQRSFTEPVSNNKSRPKSSGGLLNNRRSALPDISTSAPERAKNLLKSRQGIIIGNLYLQAGRWADALRELVDSTTRARAFSDHVWHAKGLENILVTMLMLTWARIDFTVPPICYPNPEKAPTTRGRSSSGSVQTSETTGDSYNRTLASLSAVIPDLVHLIINIHNKATNVTGEALPQFPYSECVVRLSYLLAIVYRFENRLNSKALDFMVHGSTSLQLETRMHMFAKRDLSNLIFKAFPSNLLTSSMPLLDTVTILSGMATVLSFSQLHRKQALVVRDMLSILIPRLIQARKVGAAEMGIHPAASLAARHGLTVDAGTGLPDESHDSIEKGFHNLLSLLCSTYGVLSDPARQLRPSGKDSDLEQPALSDTENEVLWSTFRNALSRDTLARSFGGFALKSDILRLCANFSEALPNFPDVIYFTVALLKTAGAGSAARHQNIWDNECHLAREEQARFSSKIHRTLGVFKSADAATLECEYWDPFLVRGVDVAQAQDVAAGPVLSIHDASHRQGKTRNASLSRNPFIHNPYQQSQAAATTTRRTIIAGEPSLFLVSLQNLYDFEVSIESIQLVGQGTEFTCKEQAALLGSRRIEQVPIYGTAHTPGELQIGRCIVKAQGFRSQEFLIFPQPWKPDADAKIKSAGLHVLENALKSPAPPSNSASKTEVKPAAGSIPPPNAASCKFHVIHAQPRLAVTGSTLPQTTLSLAEGEANTFSVHIKNVSETTAVDFLHLTLANGPHVIFSQSWADKPETTPSPLEWIRDPTTPLLITPQSSQSLTLALTGQTALADLTLHMQYARQDVPSPLAASQPSTPLTPQTPTVPADAPMRALALPLRATVTPSVRLEGAYLVRGVIPPPELHTGTDEVGRSGDSTADPDASLLLDFTNAAHLTMDVDVRSEEARTLARRTVSPGDVERVVVPVRIGERDAREGAALVEEMLKGLEMGWRNGATGRRGRVSRVDVALGVV